MVVILFISDEKKGSDKLILSVPTLGKGKVSLLMKDLEKKGVGLKAANQDWWTVKDKVKAKATKNPLTIELVNKIDSKKTLADAGVDNNEPVIYVKKKGSPPNDPAAAAKGAADKKEEQKKEEEQKKAEAERKQKEEEEKEAKKKAQAEEEAKKQAEAEARKKEEEKIKAEQAAPPVPPAPVPPAHDPPTPASPEPASPPPPAPVHPAEAPPPAPPAPKAPISTPSQPPSQPTQFEGEKSSAQHFSPAPASSDPLPLNPKPQPERGVELPENTYIPVPPQQKTSPAQSGNSQMHLPQDNQMHFQQMQQIRTLQDLDELRQFQQQKVKAEDGTVAGEAAREAKWKKLLEQVERMKFEREAEKEAHARLLLRERLHIRGKAEDLKQIQEELNELTRDAMSQVLQGLVLQSAQSRNASPSSPVAQSYPPQRSGSAQEDRARMLQSISSAMPAGASPQAQPNTQGYNPNPFFRPDSSAPLAQRLESLEAAAKRTEQAVNHLSSLPREAWSNAPPSTQKKSTTTVDPSYFDNLQRPQQSPQHVQTRPSEGEADQYEAALQTLHNQRQLQQEQIQRQLQTLQNQVQCQQQQQQVRQMQQLQQQLQNLQHQQTRRLPVLQTMSHSSRAPVSSSSASVLPSVPCPVNYPVYSQNNSASPERVQKLANQMLDLSNQQGVTEDEVNEAFVRMLHLRMLRDKALLCEMETTNTMQSLGFSTAAVPTAKGTSSTWNPQSPSVKGTSPLAGRPEAPALTPPSSTRRQRWA